MPEDSFELAESTVRKLARDHQRLKAQVQNLTARVNVRDREVPQEPLLIGKAAETIAADGSGSFTVWWRKSGTATATTQTIQAFDWLGTGINSGDSAYFIPHWESGIWGFIRRPELFVSWTAQGLADTGGISGTDIGDLTTLVLDDVIDFQSDVITLSSNAATIAEAGWYIVTWSGTFEFSAASAQTFWVVLEENTGGGFAPVPRTLRGFEHGAGVGDGHSYMQSIDHRVAAGAQYRLGAYVSATIATVNGHTNFPYQGNSLDIVKANWA